MLYKPKCPVCGSETSTVHKRTFRKILEIDGEKEIYQPTYRCVDCNRFYVEHKEAPRGCKFSWGMVRLIMGKISLGTSYEAISMHLKERFGYKVPTSTICDLKRRYMDLYEKGEF